MPGELVIRRHTVEEVRTLIAVATRAFWDDPMFNFFQPDLLRQHRSLSGFFAAGITDCAAHGEVLTATLDGTVAGISAWLPPGVHVATKGLRALKQARLALPTLLSSPRRRQAYALMNEMPKHHLQDPHWYLAVLATDPLFQGRGVGRALIEPTLARCDDEGVPSYLETQKESNLPYYHRFGYEVAEVLNINGCPPLWTMIRQPR
jgi:GNAT superfamily N-acetyltransferase